VAGAPGVVLGFGSVWAGGWVEPSRKPYESWALTKAMIWVLQLGKFALESLICKVWFMLGIVKTTLDEDGGVGFVSPEVVVESNMMKGKKKRR
jgi:hypothetical protein